MRERNDARLFRQPNEGARYHLLFEDQGTAIHTLGLRSEVRGTARAAKPNALDTSPAPPPSAEQQTTLGRCAGLFDDRNRDGLRGGRISSERDFCKGK